MGLPSEKSMIRQFRCCLNLTEGTEAQKVLTLSIQPKETMNMSGLGYRQTDTEDSVSNPSPIV